MTWTRLSSGALRLSGPDRVDFLHGQMTADLRRAPVPGMRPALFLSVRGQIEHFVRLYRRADDVYLHLEESEVPALEARLRKYVVFDQVEIEDLTGRLAALHLWSQDVPGWDAGGPDCQQFELAGTQVLAARVNRTGELGLDMHVLAGQLDGVLARLGGEAAPEELERARVRAALPDVARDHWQGSLPQEVGLTGAVSFRKGCYVGQEIMARLEARGQARFHLAALEGEDLPSYAQITRAGKPAGVSGHAAGGRALAKLRAEVAPGDEVEVEGRRALVRDVLAPA